MPRFQPNQIANALRTMDRMTGPGNAASPMVGVAPGASQGPAMPMQPPTNMNPNGPVPPAALNSMGQMPGQQLPPNGMRPPLQMMPDRTPFYGVTQPGTRKF